MWVLWWVRLTSRVPTLLRWMVLMSWGCPLMLTSRVLVWMSGVGLGVRRLNSMMLVRVSVWVVVMASKLGLLGLLFIRIIALGMSLSCTAA